MSAARRPAPGGGPSLRATPIFAPGGADPVPLLDRDQQARLGVIATIRHIPPGDIVYRAGEPARHLYVLIEGVAKTYLETGRGRRRITSFLFPEDLMGLGVRGVHASHAQAVTALTAWQLPAEALETLLRHDSELEFHFLTKVCHDLREAQRHAVTLGRTDAQGKLAMFVALLADKDPGGKTPRRPVPVPMSRSDIADYVGLTLEAVSRSFRALERADVVRFLNRHALEIVNHAALDALVASG